MTFNKIALTMFKANIRRYLLYFLCNSFTVMVLFTYLTLLTNESFMDKYKVNSVISSNLIAPSIVIGIFSVFFIIYTQNSFIKFRKNEFGLFMVLGMVNSNIAAIMLIENSIIAVISLLSGLIAGTLFSRIFYFIVVKIIGVNGFTFSLYYKSYFYAMLLFISIYIVVILGNIIISLRYNIVKLLKSSRIEDKNQVSGKAVTLICSVFIGIAIFDMINNYKTGQSIVLLRSTLLCFIGVYLIISNFVWLLTKFIKSSPKKYYKNMLFISNLKYTFNQSKKIIFVISLLVGITIFFSSIALIFTSSAKNFTVRNNPYDIQYVEIHGKNSIPQDKLNNIIQNNETPLILHKTLEFISLTNMTILSDQNLNNTLGTSIHVGEGNFINLFQIVENDGYSHDTSEIKQINIKTKNGNNTLTSQGSIRKVLFDNTPILSSTHYIIVSSNDYINIKAEGNSKEIGYINLMNFSDWRKTEYISQKLETELENYNRINTKPYYDTINQDIAMFKSVSKIGQYMEQKQSGSFLLFLLVFVGVLFYVSSGVILHFKLLTEFEREKVKYKKLYKVGITNDEVSKTISKEFAVLFFLPYILGMLLSIFYNYCLTSKNIGINYKTSIGYPFMLGLMYLVLQLLYYVIYKRIYIKKVISCVS